MIKLSQLLERAAFDRKVTQAPAILAADRRLTEMQLDNVVAGGSKPGIATGGGTV